MYVRRQLSKALTQEVHIRTCCISLRNTGQIRIWRSSGRGQGHSSNKGRKSLFPHCKTSTGNNSGSIKYTAVKFVSSMGFSAMADWMAWSSPLSRDRKSPCINKYTHSRMVDRRLEGNLAVICYLRENLWRRWMEWGSNRTTQPWPLKWWYTVTQRIEQRTLYGLHVMRTRTTFYELKTSNSKHH